MSAPEWQWDASHQAWYYWDPVQNRYVWQTQTNNEEENQDNNVVLTTVEEGTPEQVTDPRALQSGIIAHKRVGARAGDAEGLDRRFVRHYPGRDFYKVGRVFKILWPEPAGNWHEGVTFVTGAYGEQIYNKIRWFVVIREGQDCCTCLPIQTYNKQGVAKPGVIKPEHSVAYTVDTYPYVPDWEDPRREMLSPIPIIPIDPAQNKMHPMSRLNYAKVYTVEHNVKTLDFGYVPPDMVANLQQNFLTVLQGPPSPSSRRTASSGSHQ
ncbi:hypothetical protein BFW01_g12577 [Lasiodiplodia theobromae]|nr:hypothetical protein BFW01_g12577 [Lasiodiplodia theobromae]